MLINNKNRLSNLSLDDIEKDLMYRAIKDLRDAEKFYNEQKKRKGGCDLCYEKKKKRNKTLLGASL